MHILLTNDDGPLDDHSCPYFKYFVDEIRSSTDWDLSIVVPSQQRSWIGKAHFAGKTLTTSYIYTKHSTSEENPDINKYEGPFDSPQSFDKDYQEWCLVDSTPAACADIGIHHVYKQKGKPVDLVLSGPNFGKNSSNLYILASGTVGAAMEASTHGVKSMAISYAFSNLDHDFNILKEAAKISVKLVQKLYQPLITSDNIDLYSINIPLISSLKLGETKVKFAPILQNQWGSIYEEQINDSKQKQYKWNPDFKAVYKDGLSDFSHSDSRVLLEEGISVTPLQACFKSVSPIEGEIILDEDDIPLNTLSIDNKDKFLITIPRNSYIYEPLVEAFSRLSFDVTDDIGILDNIAHSAVKVFHYGDYEDINIDLISQAPEKYFIPSYIYRKALIRKHFLANTIHHYTVKNPTSILNTAVPESYQLEVDYAEFLDDALDDAYELREEVEAGEKTWILKPSMSDKGQGIRLFKNIDQLQAIFDSFEVESDDEEAETTKDDNNGVIISQLRHFIVQEYKSNPLLLNKYGNKKFHLRTYVVCKQNLTVYVYKNILTLFSDSQYTSPDSNDEEEISMEGHLTNTCLQESETPMVVPFWDLKDDKFSDNLMEDVFKQVCEISGELFKAATSVDKMNFQPLDNAMEVFGVDFLVGDDYNVTLLEVNSYPDFKQTGDDLKEIIYQLFNEVASKIVVPMVKGSTVSTKDSSLIEVLSI